MDRVKSDVLIGEISKLWTDDQPQPTRESIVADLLALRDCLPTRTASMAERQRTYQNIGAYIMRHGRLDAIIQLLGDK